MSLPKPKLRRLTSRGFRVSGLGYGFKSQKLCNEALGAPTLLGREPTDKAKDAGVLVFLRAGRRFGVRGSGLRVQGFRLRA